MALAIYPFFEEKDMEEKERFFSVELKSKANLKNVTLTNSGHENVLIEGTVGQLQHASFVDGVVLEVVCDKGVLRINLTPDEIKQKKTETEEKQ
jgi:hypothetical protein